MIIYDLPLLFPSKAIFGLLGALASTAQCCPYHLGVEVLGAGTGCTTQVFLQYSCPGLELWVIGALGQIEPKAK